MQSISLTNGNPLVVKVKGVAYHFYEDNFRHNQSIQFLSIHDDSDLFIGNIILNHIEKTGRSMVEGGTLEGDVDYDKFVLMSADDMIDWMVNDSHVDFESVPYTNETL